MISMLLTKMMTRWFVSFGMMLMMGCSFSYASTATLSNIQVNNGSSSAQLVLNFDGVPEYTLFPLHNPERLVIDIRQSNEIQGLPIKFNQDDFIRQVRSSRQPDAQHQRIVLELASKTKTNTQTGVVNGVNQLTISLADPATIVNNSVQNHAVPIQSVTTDISVPTISQVRPLQTEHTQIRSIAPESEALIQKKAPQSTLTTSPSSASKPILSSTSAISATETSSMLAPKPITTKTLPQGSRRVVVAIDAGHGGKDPGAIGPNGFREKDVTLRVSRKLQARLNADPMFSAVLTRDGDYFIAVAGRSDVARRQSADMLVSIHADSAPSRAARGASVWVLSTRRANNELGNWLEQREKQSELLGGAGDVLANGGNRYLSQAVLDLQFGHSQRVGYDVATKVIEQLHTVGNMHKRAPEHASLGVLRSPDIPSILVETGFISNAQEEQLLQSDDYQNRLADAIHYGLRNYFTEHPLKAQPK